MGLIYKKLFSLVNLHDFYVSGISQDFSIGPTQETGKLMRDNKLLFKTDQNNANVFYRAVDAGSDNSFVDFANLELWFAMKLENVASFINITDLDLPGQDFTNGNLLYFTNDTVTAHTLAYSIIDFLRPKQFNYAFPQTGVPGDVASIAIYNETGGDVTPVSPDPNNIQPGNDGKFHYPVDLSGLPSGIYSFVTQVNADPPETQTAYLSNELAGTNTFGIIKINAVNALPASFPVASGGFAARQYNAVFVRRNSIWRYVVVPKLSALNWSEVTVTDEELVPPPPPPYNAGPYTFHVVGSVFVNGVESAMVESDIEIPFYEIPKKKLSVQNITTSDTVLSNIANPSRDLISADPTDFDVTVIYVIV